MTITVEEAKSRLPELLDELRNGPITLTSSEIPVAQIVAAEVTPGRRPILGGMKGTVLYMAPDFNDTPPGFEEYMLDSYPRLPNSDLGN